MSSAEGLRCSMSSPADHPHVLYVWGTHSTLTADHPSRDCCIRTDLTISDECNIGKAVAFIDPLAADVICHPTLQVVG